MKIVRVIARLNVGGPAKHVVWLTQGLPAPEWDTLLVAGTVPPGEDDMAYFADRMGVAPLFVPEMSREVSVKDLLTIWKLYKLFRRERPDIVHTHTAKAGTVGRVAGLLYRWLTPSMFLGRKSTCRFVHTYHGHIFHSYYGPLKTRVFIAIERMLGSIATDRLVVVSEQQRREINQQFGVGRADQFVVIPLGLDLDAFSDWKERGQAFRHELDLKVDDLLIGIVGRLTEVKNHKLFLEAVSLFSKAYRPQPPEQRVKFVIVGDGALRTELEQQAHSLGLDHQVTFVGTRRDMENTYPALDIVALTSLNEGTPLTLIEAMANARPVISSAVGGVVDLLGPVTTKDIDRPYTVCERGIGVPPGNADAFAQGLSRLVEDVALRREMGERGLQFVNSRYSKDRLLEDVRKLYVDLHQGKKLPVRAGPGEQRLESRL
jgi:glycosyltransferase involved in cell wall biosynthesis